jgi:hypothetical protein
MTRAKWVSTYTALAFLTLAQLYVVNAFLFRAWNTANFNNYHHYWRLRVERWQLVSVIVDLLWVSVLVVLIRSGIKLSIASRTVH